MSVLGATCGPATAKTFPSDAVFVPGSKLYVKMNSSSIEVGQVVVREYKAPDGTVISRPAPGMSINLRYADLLVSKTGVYLINGDPDTALEMMRKGEVDGLPVAEIRLEFPLWVYPKTVRDRIAEEVG